MGLHDNRGDRRVNAGDAAYSSAWTGSAVCSSPDRRAWSRCWNTMYDAESGTLSWEYDHAATNGMPVYFSYFDLYPYDRHLDLIARVAASPSITGIIMSIRMQS